MYEWRGIQKDCDPIMKEQRHKGHPMYENTTSQFKDICRNVCQLHSWHTLLEEAYLKKIEIGHASSVVKSSTKIVKTFLMFSYFPAGWNSAT